MTKRTTNLTRREILDKARSKWQAIKPSAADRFWPEVEIRGDNECWPWKAAVRRENEGYGAFWMNGRHHPANRVALQLSGVEVPDGMAACHKCDNPRCCNPAHLFVATHRENNDDKVRKQRHAKGRSHGMAKLTSEQICEIKSHKPPEMKRMRAGLLQELASKYGVSRTYISIICNSNWRSK